jgi:hypothetical protein
MDVDSASLGTGQHVLSVKVASWARSLASQQRVHGRTGTCFLQETGLITRRRQRSSADPACRTGARSTDCRGLILHPYAIRLRFRLM